VVADDEGEADSVALALGDELAVAGGLVVGSGLGEAGELEAELGVVAGVVGGVVVGGVVVGGVVVGGVVVGGGVVDVSASGSHCEAGWLAAVKAAAPGLAVAARLPGARAALTTSPAVVVSKTPPARRPAETGRTRAKHMEGPACAVRCSSTLLVCPGWFSHSPWTILSYERVPMRVCPRFGSYLPETFI
jgi:hypothetical protein